jgi:GT2 family glycosyltransferase/glycosyltransferase involved in cell wall biosynthesis
MAAIPVPREAPPGPVLFVTYSGVWGGAERLLVEYAAGIEQPAVVLCAEGPLADRVRAAGLHVLVRPRRAAELRGGARTRVRAAEGLAAHAGEIRSVVRSLRPAAVLAFGMRSAIAAAVSTRGTPLVFEHVDFLPSEGVAKVVRAAASAADRVVALSTSIGEDLDPDGALGDRLRVATPGIDLDRYDASPPPDGPPTALLLGAIASWKRPDLALEAVALAARRLPELRLVVAGHAVGRASESLLEELRRRATQPDLAGRVEFAGALADPRPALARASCLLHCADREPFGLVLLEAMASGRPVVAPAAGGPVEIVADDSGALYPPGDAEAAARALVATLGDGTRLAEAGRSARRRVEARFTLAAARARWSAAVAPLLGPRPAVDGAGLTLVTVTHNSESELRRLLASARRHLPRAAVVVVDSGSRDGSVEAARHHDPDVRIVELENVGYGRAANRGVELVETPACIVLNPDVELVDGSLAALAGEALGPRPERVLAPLVLHPDGSRQDTAHLEPISAAAVLSALVPPAALPAPLRRSVQPWRADRPRPIAWAVGCCFGARTDVLRRLGPFDERIFLYAEDMELGLRAGDLGIETWWWPHARVIHYEAHSSRDAFGGEAFELLARQRHAVVAERRGAAAARWDTGLQATTFASRIAAKALLRRANARERRQLSALLHVRDARLSG